MLLSAGAVSMFTFLPSTTKTEDVLLCVLHYPCKLNYWTSGGFFL